MEFKEDLFEVFEGCKCTYHGSHRVNDLLLKQDNELVSINAEKLDKFTIVA